MPCHFDSSLSQPPARPQQPEYDRARGSFASAINRTAVRLNCESSKGFRMIGKSIRLADALNPGSESYASLVYALRADDGPGVAAWRRRM